MKFLWNYLSSIGINENSDVLDYQNKRLMNQYLLIISLICLLHGVRDLLNHLNESGLLLVFLSLYLVISLYTTQWRFNKLSNFIFNVFLGILIFIFESLYGRNCRVDYLYFPLIFSLFFTFNTNVKSENRYLIITISTIVFLFSFNFFTDYSLFHFYNFSIKEQKEISIIVLTDSILFIVVTLIYYNKKKILLHEFFENKEKTDQIIENLKKELEVKKAETKNETKIDIIEIAKKNDIFFTFEMKKQFPQFHTSLMKINPIISEDEFRFCSFLKLGFSTKDISKILNISVRSVESRKYRLRKHYHIDSDINLNDWFNSL